MNYFLEGMDMKVELLLGIGIYLMNHQRVTAQTLATRFGIFIDDVRREIHTLILAGIPIIVTYGIDGGYEILDYFKKRSHLQNQYDYSNIKEALVSLSLAIKPNIIEETLLQMEVLEIAIKEYRIRELFAVNAIIELHEKVYRLLQAFIRRKIVYINYQEPEHMDIISDIEIVIIIYKDCEWQVLCYCNEEDKYQGIPVRWMKTIEVKDQGYSKVHSVIEVKNVWKDVEISSELTYIKIFCSKDIKEQVDELFHGKVIEELNSGDFVYEFQGRQSDLSWYGRLFLMWRKIKIIEPLPLIEKIRQDCNSILEKYKE